MSLVDVFGKRGQNRSEVFRVLRTGKAGGTV